MRKSMIRLKTGFIMLNTKHYQHPGLPLVTSSLFLASDWLKSVRWEQQRGHRVERDNSSFALGQDWPIRGQCTVWRGTEGSVMDSVMSPFEAVPERARAGTYECSGWERVSEYGGGRELAIDQGHLADWPIRGQCTVWIMTERWTGPWSMQVLSCAFAA